jgi:cytochrome c peroxidase
MARVQLGKRLNDEQIAHIVAFLDSLTGKLPDTFATVPVLPSAGFAGTPREPAVGAGAPQSPTAAPPGPAQR